MSQSVQPEAISHVPLVQHSMDALLDTIASAEQLHPHIHALNISVPAAQSLNSGHGGSEPLVHWSAGGG